MSIGSDEKTKNSSVIPDEHLKSHINFHLAPMIDFLFIMLAFFASLSVSRSSLIDHKLDLVELKSSSEIPTISSNEEMHQIHLSISKKGEYLWVTDIHDYPMNTLENIQSELVHQYNMGILPKDKNKTEVLLHIDRNAPWDKIAKLIFCIKEIGFDAKPVYELKDR